LESEGLILWTGKNDGDKQEFFTVALNDGHPCITFAFGSTPHVVAGLKRYLKTLKNYIKIV
jgi:hypothetical protein